MASEATRLLTASKAGPTVTGEASTQPSLEPPTRSTSVATSSSHSAERTVQISISRAYALCASTESIAVWVVSAAIYTTQRSSELASKATSVGAASHTTASKATASAISTSSYLSAKATTATAAAAKTATAVTIASSEHTTATTGTTASTEATATHASKAVKATAGTADSSEARVTTA